MGYWVYILQSESSGRYYCGSTDSVERRLRQHNDPDYRGTKTTKRFGGPWKLVWKEAHTSRAEAMGKEKQIKKRGIRRFLQDSAQLVESRRRRD
jgi:putative endonuclease